MKHNALALCFLGLMGFAGSASATFSVPNSSPSPGATGQSAVITYTTRAGVGQAGFQLAITDANDVIVDASVNFQVFDFFEGNFVNCDGNEVTTAGNTGITCSQAGVYSIRRTNVSDLQTLSSNMRVQYNISGGATDGQTATLGFGAYCNDGQSPAADGCVIFNDTNTTQRVANPDLPVATNGTVTITVSADRALSFAPNFGTTITFPAGATPGTAAPAQTITVTASGNQGTATLTGCTTAAPFSVTPASLTFNNATPGPFDLSVGCSYPTSNATGTLTCTQTDQGGAPTQRTWDLSCPAPNAAPTVTVSPAGGTPIAVGSAAPNEFGTAGITFTATGGSGNSPFSINCSSTGAVQLALGGAAFTGQTANQALTGAQAPQQVRVGVQLTNNAQPAAGNVSCDITDAGGTRTVTYAISAGAGISVPLFVPASSLWSQLALIALFLGLGGVVLVLRRNG